MNGLMMDWPLLIPSILRRAAREMGGEGPTNPYHRLVFDPKDKFGCGSIVSPPREKRPPL